MKGRRVASKPRIFFQVKRERERERERETERKREREKNSLAEGTVATIETVMTSRQWNITEPLWIQIECNKSKPLNGLDSCSFISVFT